MSGGKPVKTAEMGTYFLGATITTHQAVDRVRFYADFVSISFGKKPKRETDGHITVVPPFRASYETASSMNLGSGLATLLSSHPINTTMFSIRGLSLMEFGGKEFLHFPVSAHSTGNETWEMYVKRVRDGLADLGIEMREEIPNEYRAHITVFGGKNLSKDKDVLRIIDRSLQEPPLYFKAAFLTLYTKYKRGWDMLSYDPASEQ